MKFRQLFASIAFIFATAAHLGAQTVTWIPTGPDHLFTTAANWVGGVVPPANASAILQFPYSNSGFIALPAGSISFGALQFGTPSDLSLASHYAFGSVDTTTLTLQSGGISKFGAAPGNHVSLDFAPSIALNLAANQTWTANAVAVNGPIGGSGRLTFQPTSPLPDTSHDVGSRKGYLLLNGPGSFAGGLTAIDAEIVLAHATALGGSAVRLVNSDLNAAMNSTVNTPLTFNGEVGLFHTHESDFTLTLASQMTLEGNVTLAGFAPATLSGKITESVGTPGSRLTVQGRLLFTGDNATGAYTGGTHVDVNGVAVFHSANSVPATGLISSSPDGYVGAGFTSGVQTSLISRLDPGIFFGTVGLDSPNPVSAQIFNEPLNLSALANFRGLGSSSAAVLNGAITIGGTQDYRFGGGGGRLTVSSALTNSTSKFILDSPIEPSQQSLTVVLKGANTFTGGTEIRHGAVIFDGATALPATGSIAFNTDSHFGYAGYTEALGLTPNQFLTRFNTSTLGGAETINVVGIDSTNPAAPRTLSTPIDLSLGGTLTAPYFLGTATRVTLTGAIQPAGNQLRLAGVNGGHLVVTAPLAPTVNSLSVGLHGVRGMVELHGASTFAGGTTVNGGTLLIGNSQALGSGTITVGDATLAASANATLRNTLFGFGPAGLNIGQPGSTANLTLLGAVGASQLNYRGGGVLRLSGIHAIGHLQIDAAGAGGVVVSSSSYSNEFFDPYFGEFDTFLGAPFGVTLNSGHLTFNGRAPQIQSLRGRNGTQLILSGGTNLSILGDFESESSGENGYTGTISGSGALSLLGDQIVSLSGNNTFSGGTFLTGGGTLAVGHNNALGSGALHVRDQGGALEALSDGITLPNTILIDPIASESAFDRGLTILGEFQLQLSGLISGLGGIQKIDGGTLRLSGNNTFSGGVLIEDGTVEFAHNNAAGTGPLVFDPFSALPAKAVFTTAAPVIHGLESAFSTLAAVELAAGSNLTINQNTYSEFRGSISGVGANNARLTKTGFGGLLLGGANSYSGGTFVTNGGVIFASSTAIPAAGSFVSSFNGYVGFGGLNTATEINTFLGKFDQPNTLGTIGFDTNTSNSYLVNTPLSLSGFTSARLGSASHALFNAAAVITPNGTSYRFGGGGGLLQVASPLTDQVSPFPITRGVIAESPATTPLTLRLTSVASTFSGGVTATHSAVIFGAGALPATGNLTLNSGGYIGSEDSSLEASNVAMGNFIARFSATNGIIGFDNALGVTSTRAISSAIDLTNSGNAYLGTASAGSSPFTPGVRLTGPLTPAGNVYRFAGYKGGSLEVASPLSGTRTVIIGDPNVFATFVDPNRSVLSPDDPVYSTVTLSGANTHVGNTTLHGGRLLLGSASALGAGTNSLVVQSTAVPAGFLGTGQWVAHLGAAAPGLVIGHNITLDSGLGLGGQNDFSLNGIISGTGGLFYDGQDFGPIVRLGGANTFTGGLHIARGDLHLDHPQAAGTGPLTLGPSGDVFFGGSAQIGGLRSDATNADVTLAGGSTLTINQNTNTVFRGDFNSTGAGGRLVKTGTGILRLEGEGDNFDGLDSAGTLISADIQQGTVVVSASADRPLGNHTIRISGGTLALDGATLDNNLLAISGRLAGAGAFTGGNPSIGANLVLAPGFSAGAGPSQIGRLNFENLTLASGGTFEWNIQALSGGGVATDAIGVTSSSTLTITSTAGSPFTLKLLSLLPDGTPGALSGLSAGETHSWLVFEANGISGFDPSKFTIDASQFASGIGPGTFSLSLTATPSLLFSQSIMLNFTPIPEPSTWALLFAGIGAIAFTTWRRRNGN